MSKNKKIKPIPRFKNEDEERDFWAAHSATDYFDMSKAVLNPVFPMKAALLRKIGNKAALSLSSVATPKPGKDEALIRVAYCGVNHLDLLIKQGKRAGPTNFPHVLGSEIVGITESGNSVAVYPWTFCGRCPQCLSGKENICDQGGTIGRTNWGGYAQYVVVPKRNLIKLPKNLPLKSICAVTLAGTTAHHLIGRARIKNKSTVLVTGATGGVGTAVIQLLKRKSCRVIAATSHKKKTSFLKKLGVDMIVKKFPQGIPYVIDLMGGKVWSNAAEVLAKNGTMVYCATTLDGPGLINIGSAFSRQINLLGSYGGTRKDLRSVIQLVKRGVLRPVIDSIYPLSRANKALMKLENQKNFGKILIKS